MPYGQIYELENGKQCVYFKTDATYGLVLYKITNMVDGTSITFPPAPLFRVVARKIQQADLFYTLESQNAANVASIVPTTGYDATTFHFGSTHESPALGGRKWLQATFNFDNFDGAADDLKVHFTASLLDSQPDRCLFALYFDNTYGNGMGATAIFWAAPILLRVPQFTADHYLIGTNCGLVTRNPKVDLVGNGSTYRFHVGRKPGIITPADEHFPAVGFEPETKAAQYDDRMEVFYPTWLAIAAAAYGSSGSDGTTICLHDPLHFNGRRVRDWYSAAHVYLEHEGLIENGITANNGWSLGGNNDLRRVETYVRVFKRLGQVLGEDLGLDYRRWALSSAEGRLIVPRKQVDATDDAPLLHTSPIFRTYFTGDDEEETSITREIAAEFRLAFPQLEDDYLYRVNYDLLYEYVQNASGTHPGLVGDAVPDLFNLKVDAAKSTYAQSLLDTEDLYTFGAVVVRRPTPYDGLGFWDSDNFDGARVKNHREAVDPGYKTTDAWLKVAKTVGAVSFNGTFTKVTLSSGALDPSLWDFFNNYSLVTAGIDHSTHKEHLGWFKKADASYAFVIERQVKTDFQANPPIIYTAGDRTATIIVGDSVQLFFNEASSIPGYDAGVVNQMGDNAPTSLCSMADEAGQGIAVPAAGWGFRYVSQFITHCRPWCIGILHVLPRLHQVCFGSHGGHIPGTNQQTLAWRRILAYMKTLVPQPFTIWEEDGPYDWLIGRVDGFTRSNRRLDLTTLVGSWGASPFFQTAWGAFQRMGAYLGGRDGHVSNFGGSALYAATMESVGLKAGFREALCADFFLGRHPSVGIAVTAGDSMGTRPDGKTAYTPFFETTYGMSVAGTMANLCARLIQLEFAFNCANMFGQRVRSLERIGVATVSYNPLLGNTAPAHENFHNIGCDELGTQRLPIFHMVMRDQKNPKRLIAIFANDGSVRRTDSYRFKPSWYSGMVPVSGSGYFAQKYNFTHSGYTTNPVEWLKGEQVFTISLDAAEVVAVVFDFTDTMEFLYRYDDASYTKVSIPTKRSRHRVSNIHGQGERFQFGFDATDPDQDIQISAAMLRVEQLTRSKDR